MEKSGLTPEKYAQFLIEKDDLTIVRSEGIKLEREIKQSDELLRNLICDNYDDYLKNWSSLNVLENHLDDISSDLDSLSSTIDRMVDTHDSSLDHLNGLQEKLFLSRIIKISTRMPTNIQSCCSSELINVEKCLSDLRALEAANRVFSRERQIHISSTIIAVALDTSTREHCTRLNTLLESMYVSAFPVEFSSLTTSTYLTNIIDSICKFSHFEGPAIINKFLSETCVFMDVPRAKFTTSSPTDVNLLSYMDSDKYLKEISEIMKPPHTIRTGLIAETCAFRLVEYTVARLEELASEQCLLLSSNFNIQNNDNNLGIIVLKIITSATLLETIPFAWSQHVHSTAKAVGTISEGDEKRGWSVWRSAELLARRCQFASRHLLNSCVRGLISSIACRLVPLSKVHNNYVNSYYEGGIVKECIDAIQALSVGLSQLWACPANFVPAVSSAISHKNKSKYPGDVFTLALREAFIDLSDVTNCGTIFKNNTHHSNTLHSAANEFFHSTTLPKTIGNLQARLRFEKLVHGTVDEDEDQHFIFGSSNAPPVFSTNIEIAGTVPGVETTIDSRVDEPNFENEQDDFNVNMKKFLTWLKGFDKDHIDFMHQFGLTSIIPFELRYSLAFQQAGDLKPLKLDRVDAIQVVDNSWLTTHTKKLETFTIDEIQNRSSNLSWYPRSWWELMSANAVYLCTKNAINPNNIHNNSKFDNDRKSFSNLTSPAVSPPRTFHYENTLGSKDDCLSRLKTNNLEILKACGWKLGLAACVMHRVTKDVLEMCNDLLSDSVLVLDFDAVSLAISGIMEFSAQVGVGNEGEVLEQVLLKLCERTGGLTSRQDDLLNVLGFSMNRLSRKT